MYIFLDLPLSDILKVAVIDSRLAYDDEILQRCNTFIIGKSGWKLEWVKDEIEEHFKSNMNSHDAIVYKICLGINSFTKITRDNRGKPKSIKIHPDVSAEYILNLIWEISDLETTYDKLHISICEIQGAKLHMYNEKKWRKSLPRSIRKTAVYPVKENVIMQNTLEEMVDFVNLGIRNNNRNSSIVDHGANRNIGEFINNAKSICHQSKKWRDRKNAFGADAVPKDKTYVKHSRAFQHTTDGIHLDDDWVFKTVHKFSVSLEKEVHRLDQLLTERNARRDTRRVIIMDRN